MRPETRYAQSGDVNIAYQVVGDGPRILVVVPGWVSNIDLFREEPHVTRFLKRLASFSRLILFDSAARSGRARWARLSRTVLELTRFFRIALVSGMAGAAGAWAPWSGWSFEG